MNSQELGQETLDDTRALLATKPGVMEVLEFLHKQCDKMCYATDEAAKEKFDRDPDALFLVGMMSMTVLHNMMQAAIERQPAIKPAWIEALLHCVTMT